MINLNYLIIQNVALKNITHLQESLPNVLHVLLISIRVKIDVLWMLAHSAFFFTVRRTSRVLIPRGVCQKEHIATIAHVQPWGNVSVSDTYVKRLFEVEPLIVAYLSIPGHLEYDVPSKNGQFRSITNGYVQSVFSVSLLI